MCGGGKKTKPPQLNAASPLSTPPPPPPPPPHLLNAAPLTGSAHARSPKKTAPHASTRGTSSLPATMRRRACAASSAGHGDAGGCMCANAPHASSTSSVRSAGTTTRASILCDASGPPPGLSLPLPLPLLPPPRISLNHRPKDGSNPAPPAAPPTAVAATRSHGNRGRSCSRESSAFAAASSAAMAPVRRASKAHAVSATEGGWVGERGEGG